MTKPNLVATSKTSYDKNGVLRKRLVVLDVSAISYEKKKEMIEEKLIRTFGEIPEGLTFDVRFTKKTNKNPDGKRVFVRCSWIKRNRFHDNEGKFHYGTLVKAINKHLLGQTKPNIMMTNGV